MSTLTFPRGSTAQLTPHFQRHEFDCHCGCAYTKHNPALSAGLEKLRVAIGLPIVLTNGYRCPMHNAAVGGSSGSLHKTGSAADIKCSGMNPVALGIIARRYFPGVGIYWYGGSAFVHVDTRLIRLGWLKSYSNESYRYTYGACPLPTIRMGSTGATAAAATRMLQRLLGDRALDGVFDAELRATLVARQKYFGLTPDGICGPLTWAALSGADRIK